jgi:hypothetical protein
MRNLKDAELIRTVALPAAGADITTTALDLGQVPPNEFRFEIELVLPALPSLVDTKKVTITLEDSADGSAYAPVVGLATLEVTGAGGAGAAAVTRRVRPPAHLRRYLRAKAAVEAAGGNSTDKTVSLALVF